MAVVVGCGDSDGNCVVVERKRCCSGGRKEVRWKLEYRLNTVGRFSRNEKSFSRLNNLAKSRMAICEMKSGARGAAKKKKATTKREAKRLPSDLAGLNSD